MAGDGQGAPRCQPFCDGRRKGFITGRRIQKNKKGLLLQTLVLTGGAEGNRTPDLLNAIQALSQLSYNPVMRTVDLIAAYFLNCKQNFCLLLKKRKAVKEEGSTVKEEGATVKEEGAIVKDEGRLLEKVPAVKKQAPTAGQKKAERAK